MPNLLKKILQTFALFTIVLLIAQACNAEKRIAKQLLKTNDSIRVCIIAPSYLMKENLKTWEIANYDSLPENTRDSIAYFKSKYLQYINDSLMIAFYTETMKEELDKYGVHVYGEDSIDAFLANDGKGYMFNIAQMTLEEYMSPFKKTLGFDTSNYKWEIWCNAMALNVWIEPTILEASVPKQKVLFGNMYVRDNIDGRFSGDFMNGDISYIYNVDSIDVNSAYRLARREGKTHAEFIFDYIMNDRMAKRNGITGTPENYLHYDPEHRKFVKAGDFRFTEMKP